MIDTSKSLPVEDAKGVVDVLIGTIPGYRKEFLEVQMQGAMDDIVDFWPETDWGTVVK